MRRDHYDDTLLYCLDDGNALLEGPAGGQFVDESATRPQTHTTEQTAIFPRGAEAEPQESFGGGLERHSLSSNRAAKPQERNFGGRAARGESWRSAAAFGRCRDCRPGADAPGFMLMPAMRAGNWVIL